jgi:hypothetical protein
MTELCYDVKIASVIFDLSFNSQIINDHNNLKNLYNLQQMNPFLKNNNVFTEKKNSD